MAASSSLTRRLLWLLLPAGALLLDWASKVWVLGRLQVGESLQVIPGFFNLSLGFNTGAIFGSFQSAPAWLRITLFTAAGLAALGYFGREFLKPETSSVQRAALGLILGPVLGRPTGHAIGQEQCLQPALLQVGLRPAQVIAVAAGF